MNDLIALRERIKDLKVLFIDDEKDIRLGTGAFLKKFFNTVRIGSDGQDGIDKFNNDIDIVIADIKMPKLNGIDMVRELKKRKENIYVIFITASRGEIDCNKELYNLYIKKPISYEDIILIMEHIDKEFN